MPANKAQFVVKNNVTLYPNITKNGLKLWYDVIGKKNNDEYSTYVLDMNSFTGKYGGSVENTLRTNQSGYADTNGLVLDGVDDYIVGRLPDSISEATVELNVKLQSLKNHQTIFQIGTYENRYEVQFSNGKIRVIKSATVIGESTDVTNKITSNCFIVVKLSSSHLSIYVNDIMVLSKTSSVPFVIGADDYVYIGSAFPNRRYMKGTINSCKIYNTLLDATSMTRDFSLEKERWNIV